MGTSSKLLEKILIKSYNKKIIDEVREKANNLIDTQNYSVLEAYDKVYNEVTSTIKKNKKKL